MRILHISHNDLDGMSPLYIGRLLVDMVNPALADDRKIILATATIGLPGQLEGAMQRIFDHVTGPDALENPTETDKTSVLYDVYDKIFISDLHIDSSLFLKILNYGLDKVYIADHHMIDYDPIASAQSFPQYREWDMKTIQRHIHIYTRIQNLLAGVNEPACGTHHFLYNVLAPTLQVEAPDIYELGKSLLTSSKLSHYVEAVRLWDTFDWKDLSDASLDRIAAERLNCVFNSLGRDTTESYFRDYILSTCDWMNLGYSISYEEAKSSKPVNGWTFNPLSACVTELVNMEFDKKAVAFKNVESLYQTFTWEINTPTLQKSLTAGLYFVQGTGLISECCDHILEFDPLIDIAIGVRGGNISLRSRRGSDVNCGEIAAAYHGGGHFNAAGINTNPLDWKWMQRNYFTGLMNLTAQIIGEAK